MTGTTLVCLNEWNPYKDLDREDIVVATDLPTLNEALNGGLRTNNLYLIQAPSGTGKSTTLKRLALNCLDAGQTVLYISAGEESIDNDLFKFGCMCIGKSFKEFKANKNIADYDSIKEKFINKYKDKLFLFSSDELYDLDPSSEDPRTYLESIIMQAGMIGCHYVFFDYLGAIPAPSEADEYSYLGKISNMLKCLADKFNLCIVTAMQTNRNFKYELAKKELSQVLFDETYMSSSIGPARKATVCMTMFKYDDMNYIDLFKNRDYGELKRIAYMCKEGTFEMYEARDI